MKADQSLLLRRRLPRTGGPKRETRHDKSVRYQWLGIERSGMVRRSVSPEYQGMPSGDFRGELGLPNP